MTRLLAIVPFILLAAVLPPEGGSHLSATQAPAGPVSTMPADADPSFEVATVKPSPGGVEGPRYSLRGRTLVAVAASLHDLIKFAYGVHASQASAHRRVRRRARHRPRRETVRQLTAAGRFARADFSNET